MGRADALFVNVWRGTLGMLKTPGADNSRLTTHRSSGRFRVGERQINRPQLREGCGQLAVNMPLRFRGSSRLRSLPPAIASQHLLDGHLARRTRRPVKDLGGL